MEQSEHKFVGRTYPALLAKIRYMHYVYVLQSERDDSIYVGNTNNLERRLSEHNVVLIMLLENIYLLG